MTFAPNKNAFSFSFSTMVERIGHHLSILRTCKRKESAAARPTSSLLQANDEKSVRMAATSNKYEQSQGTAHGPCDD
jgi:hypothetical protein